MNLFRPNQSLLLSVMLTLLVMFLSGVPVQSQTNTQWTKQWTASQYADIAGDYQRVDPDNGAKWICLSHGNSPGGAAYAVVKPGDIVRSTRVIVKVYGYDDGLGSGTQVGIYNPSARVATPLFALGKSPGWYSGSTTTDISSFTGVRDSIKLVVVAAAADHGHIQTVQLTIEYLTSPPDLSPTVLQLKEIVRAAPGENLDGRLKVAITNRGGQASGTFSYGLYISRVWRVRTTDRLLINGKVQVSNLAPGAEVQLSSSAGIQIPGDLAPGGYYLAVIADGDSIVTESDETNNYLMIPITINSGCGELLLHADFNGQTTGSRPDSSLPGEPFGDSIYYSQTNRYGGYLTVQDTISGFPNHALVARVTSPLSVMMHYACASPNGHPQVRVSLWYSSNDHGNISLNDGRGGTIATLGPKTNLSSSFYSGTGSITVPHSMNGYLEFSLDFERKISSLSIDGTPMAAVQGVPFLDAASTYLGDVGINLIKMDNNLEAAYLVFDDLIAEASPARSVSPSIATPPCPGQAYDVSWPARAGVTGYRLYENNRVIYEGSYFMVSIMRPAGIWVYALQEQDACGWGGLSDSVKYVLRGAPDAPDTILTSRETVEPGQLFTISWDSVPGAATYELYEGAQLMQASSQHSCSFSFLQERIYQFTVKACSRCGCSELSRPVSVSVQSPTDVTEPGTDIPMQFSLSQNYPNPFNPSTRIDFALPKACEVNIEVFNLLGQRVRTLVNGLMAAGQHSVEWNSTDAGGWLVGSGVYVYRLRAGGFIESRKMLLLR